MLDIAVGGTPFSGQQAMMRILKLAGGQDLSQSLFPPDGSKFVGSRGSWLNPMNSRILQVLGGRWYSPPDLRNPVQALKTPVLRLMEEHVGIRQDLVTEPFSFCIDPQLTFCLDAWDTYQLSSTPFVALLSQPDSVVASLVERSRLSPQHALAIWYQYVRTSIEVAGQRPSLLIFWEDFLVHPSPSLAELGALIENVSSEPPQVDLESLWTYSDQTLLQPGSGESTDTSISYPQADEARHYFDQVRVGLDSQVGFQSGSLPPDSLSEITTRTLDIVREVVQVVDWENDDSARREELRTVQRLWELELIRLREVYLDLDQAREQRIAALETELAMTRSRLRHTEAQFEAINSYALSLTSIYERGRFGKLREIISKAFGRRVPLAPLSAAPIEADSRPEGN